jgi:hypothetical protein
MRPESAAPLLPVSGLGLGARWERGLFQHPALGPGGSLLQSRKTADMYVALQLGPETGSLLTGRPATHQHGMGGFPVLANLFDKSGECLPAHLQEPRVLLLQDRARHLSRWVRKLEVGQSGSEKPVKT